MKGRFSMKKQYISLYKKITPLKSDEELLDSIFRKAENMNTSKNIRFKKPIAAICAAAAALSLGITAAATGFINFSEIFGGHINSEDETLANSLLSQAENIKWSVSDDNYEIKMNGTAGTNNCVIASFEIVRKDGKPVSDFIVNMPKDGDSIKTVGHEDLVNAVWGSYSSELDININDEGNLDIYSCIKCDDNLNGATISYGGCNFYPTMLLKEFEEKNNVFAHYGSDTGTGFYTFENPPVLTDLSMDSKEIVTLELDWNLEFTYKANELAAVEKKIADKNASIEMETENVYAYGDNYEIIPTVYTMKITDSCFTQINGQITAQYSEAEYCSMFPKVNYSNTAVIMNDGTEIPAVIHSSFGTSYSDNIYETIFEIKYNSDAYGNLTVIDINNVKGVRIFDKYFELE